MKKWIVALVLAFSTITVANATQTTIDTTASLTDAQKAELAAQAAKMVQENTSTAAPTGPNKTVAVVKEWADIGTAIGTGLAASAKELGIAANDFAQTPVGRFTVFLIAWHFIGQTILHVVFTLLWFFLVGLTLLYVWRRSCLRVVTSVYEKGEGPGGARKVTKKEPIPSPDSAQPIHAFLGIGSAVYVIVLAFMLCNL